MTDKKDQMDRPLDFQSSYGSKKIRAHGMHWQLLINGFLKEIISEIKSDTIRKFVENKLEFQVYGY